MMTAPWHSHLSTGLSRHDTLRGAALGVIMAEWGYPHHPGAFLPQYFAFERGSCCPSHCSALPRCLCTFLEPANSIFPPSYGGDGLDTGTMCAVEWAGDCPPPTHGACMSHGLGTRQVAAGDAGMGRGLGPLPPPSSLLLETKLPGALQASAAAPRQLRVH